jgi:hypothetical protein
MVDLEILNDTIESRQISHIIIRETGAYGLEELPNNILDFIRSNFVEIKYDRFGDFVVFQRL